MSPPAPQDCSSEFCSLNPCDSHFQVECKGLGYCWPAWRAAMQFSLLSQPLFWALKDCVRPREDAGLQFHFCKVRPTLLSPSQPGFQPVSVPPSRGRSLWQDLPCGFRAGAQACGPSGRFLLQCRLFWSGQGIMLLSGAHSCDFPSGLPPKGLAAALQE